MSASQFVITAQINSCIFDMNVVLYPRLVHYVWVAQKFWETRFRHSLLMHLQKMGRTLCNKKASIVAGL